jgi:hypothetical protein
MSYGGVDFQRPGGLSRHHECPAERTGAVTRRRLGSGSMQPAKFSVCLGFIALCIVTAAMVTAPFSEERRRDKSFLTSTWIFHAPQAPSASGE